MKLPWITDTVLEIGRYPFEIIVVPGTILFVAAIVSWFLVRYTSDGHKVWHRFVAIVPLVGPVIRAARLAASRRLAQE